MRLIDADAYMEKVEREAQAMPQEKGEDFIILSEWIMEKTPSVEPKQGEWIDIPRKMFKCSECGQTYQVLEPKNFCSNCGARMK